MKEGRLFREREPIGVRRKEFWSLNSTESLLGEKFCKKLGHEPDGLIFQPTNDVSRSLDYLFAQIYSIDTCFILALQGGPVPRSVKMEASFSQLGGL